MDRRSNFYQLALADAQAGHGLSRGALLKAHAVEERTALTGECFSGDPDRVSVVATDAGESNHEDDDIER